MSQEHEQRSSSVGGRQLRDWVLEALTVEGCEVQGQPPVWRVQACGDTDLLAGQDEMVLVLPGKEAEHPGAEVLTWESPMIQYLLERARSGGIATQLWPAAASEEEGLELVRRRLEVEGSAIEVHARDVVERPGVHYNFKVRWQGSESREELRTLRFDPHSSEVGEVPPSDQYAAEATPHDPRPAGKLGIHAGFEKAREMLEVSLREKLIQRLRRARAGTREEEDRLNAYYARLIKEETEGPGRRGQKRSKERAELVKREWRQKLEGLGGGSEKATYGLVSGSIVWNRWLEAEVRISGRPILKPRTEVDLVQRRWPGLRCDRCGEMHTAFRRERASLVGLECVT